MKHLNEYLIEHCKGCGVEEEETTVDKLAKQVKNLEKRTKDAEDAAEDAQKDAEKANDEADKAKKEATKAEESVKTEKDFRSYAENKFKEVFGDNLDRDQMNKVVDGILDKCADEVKDNHFGKAIGMLNKSFGK